MDEHGNLYLDEDAPEEDRERAEEWGNDEVERFRRKFEEAMEKALEKAESGR